MGLRVLAGIKDVAVRILDDVDSGGWVFNRRGRKI